jgi:spoIIIJ-associated protein
MDIENLKQNIKDALLRMAELMLLDCKIEVTEEVDDLNKKTIAVSVHAPDSAKFLIGKNGQNIRAFEHVLRMMFLKDNKEIRNIIIDVNDYKKAKTSHLIELAKSIVTRVRSTQKAEALPPMSPYERRIVHMELAAYPDITTESIGSEPQRRIVVKPYA